jgi:hypothetical protein
VDSIPLLGLAEVIPVVVSKRDPHVSTSEPNDVAAARSSTGPPMEGSTSAERQPKLVVTQRPVTMPTHARPPDAHDLSLEPLPSLMATAAIEITADDTPISDPWKTSGVTTSAFSVGGDRGVKSVICHRDTCLRAWGDRGLGQGSRSRGTRLGGVCAAWGRLAALTHAVLCSDVGATA